MVPPLKSIDPEWAWSPFVPSVETPWTRRLAALLYRRAGFAATWEELDAASRRTPAEVVATLCGRRESAEFRAEMARLARSSLSGGDARRLPAWWLYRMLVTPEPLLEQATLFWHGHFATSAAKVTDPELMYQQNELLRRHALGDFGSLVHEVARDPAMLLWLDSATNRRLRPNENFARELMELFCLGEGQYTELDIRELARCFSGWEVRRGRFRVNPDQQDVDSKSILGSTGPFTGDDGVDLVLRQSAAPRFIVRKLIRFYVFDEPEASEDLVEPLARQFEAGGLQTRPIIERILGSNLFFSVHARGRKVKSPVDLAVGFLRALSGSTNFVKLSQDLAELGQDLFFPPNVKGWDGGRSWINSSTLLGRSNLIQGLLRSGATRFAGGSLRDLLNQSGAVEPRAIVDRLDELLFAVPLPEKARDQAIELIDRQAGDREMNLRDAVHLVCTLPEFQLS